ncbi:hypothetical protein K2173_021758 [Erythroxylum novogranatense]|uniref:Uncharacterized protein n=1 Tax=Erythroxylum novogranatense TaxID=1862640 RepID=A0AAV8TXI9_9ROSI|nr:hypothetical protein K2173_021758 [Erythroxylum novogranatense]
MGSVVSKAANGIGTVIGNAFTAPFKTILGESCEDVCSGPWDVVCFIEHLCIANLIKLLLILVLCYITLLFFYLLFKLGICQCIGRSLCKMCWAACHTYLHSLNYITCFLWHKLKNTKRVHRHRFRDIERGYSSSSESEVSGYARPYAGTKRKSIREGRKAPLRSSRYHSRRYSHSNHHCSKHHNRHHVRLKTRQVSFHIKGSSQRLRNSRRLQLVKARKPRKGHVAFKRRRLR